MTITEQAVDFSTVTEAPDNRATAEQISILYTRYDLARLHARGDVLEIACGTGMGLGLLASRGARVEAGDLEPRNCAVAQRTYAGRPGISVREMNAERLPYPGQSFDLVILFEALYYLHDARRFFNETRRVLRPGGVLIVSAVNPEWPGFNPSPFSTHYFSARELAAAFEEAGYSVKLRAGFPEQTGGLASKAIGLIRRAAVKLDLIPKTQKSKEGLKRLFYGNLRSLPAELPVGFATPEPLVDVSPSAPLSLYKFIYGIGTCQH